MPDMDAEMAKVMAQTTVARDQANAGAIAFGDAAPPLPGPWKDSGEFAMGMLALFFALLLMRFIVKRCAQKNPKFNKALGALESDLAAGYPWITAVLALLVIAANGVLLGGLLRTLDSFAVVGTHVQAGTVQVNGTILAFEARVHAANTTFANFSASMNEAIDEMRKVSRANAAELFTVAVPNAAGGHAKAIIERNSAQALGTLAASSAAAEQVKLRLESFGAQQLPFQSLTDDINSLSYMVDQISSAVEILDKVSEMRRRQCEHSNCSRVVRSKIPDIDMRFVEALDVARKSIAAVSKVYDGSPNVTFRSLLVLMPADVRFQISSVDMLHGQSKVVTQKMVDTLRLQNASQLYTQPLYRLFEDVDSRAVSLQTMLNDQVKPLLSQTFTEVLAMTGQARSLLNMVASLAPRLGTELGDTVRLPAIMCAVYGMVVALLVFVYAISMRWGESKFLCLRVVKSFFEMFGYFTLYLLIDLFVLFSFFFFFAVLLMCVVDAGLVASCRSISAHGPITKPACDEIIEKLDVAVVLMAAGGVINFLLSYHLIAALQATYSQYVASAGPAVMVVSNAKEAAAVNKVVAGESAAAVLGTANKSKTKRATRTVV